MTWALWLAAIVLLVMLLLKWIFKFNDSLDDESPYIVVPFSGQYKISGSFSLEPGTLSYTYPEKKMKTTNCPSCTFPIATDGSQTPHQCTFKRDGKYYRTVFSCLEVPPPQTPMPPGWPFKAPKLEVKVDLVTVGKSGTFVEGLKLDDAKIGRGFDCCSTCGENALKQEIELAKEKSRINKALNNFKFPMDDLKIRCDGQAKNLVEAYKEISALRDLKYAQEKIIDADVVAIRDLKKQVKDANAAFASKQKAWERAWSLIEELRASIAYHESRVR